MAIIDHFAVTILVDGKPAPEYDDTESVNESNDPKIVTKYVEVKSGSRFAFKSSVLSSYRPGNEEGIACRYLIDGSPIPGQILRTEWMNDVIGFTRILDTQIVTRGGEDSRMTFRFADLETRDTCEEDIATLKDKYAGLGCLQVRMTPVRILRDVTGVDSRPRHEVGVVPEKALKGRAISVAAKCEQTPWNGNNRPQVVDIEDLEGASSAKFIFLYRTRAALQSELIIPRSPSPLNLEQKAVEDLTPEEMRELIRRQREKIIDIEEDVPNLKRERPLSSIVPLRPLKTTKTSEGKTVYHLDSDEEEEATLPPPTPQQNPDHVETGE